MNVKSQELNSKKLAPYGTDVSAKFKVTWQRN